MWNDPEFDETLREQMHQLADQEGPSRLFRQTAREWEQQDRNLTTFSHARRIQNEKIF